MDDNFGKITAGLSAQNNLVIATVNFVSKMLPAWRDDPDRPPEESEDRLNLQLVKFLDSQARNHHPMVRFDHEEYQSGTRSVDISASSPETIVLDAIPYNRYEPFLVLECKRLPAPTKSRETEYVTGLEKKSGGIQRFKLGLHGSKLHLVIMIGYLQKASAKSWYEKINIWISDLSSGVFHDGCSWNTAELLNSFSEDTSKGLSSCRSVHERIESNSEKVEICHLWIRMN